MACQKHRNVWHECLIYQVGRDILKIINDKNVCHWQLTITCHYLLILLLSTFSKEIYFENA